MRNACLFLVARLMCLATLGVATGQSAAGTLTGRDYFNELRDANAFSHYGDEYVCFPDEDKGNFAIIARTKDIEKMGAKYSKPGEKQKSLGDSLVEQPYSRGVASGVMVDERVQKESDEKWSVESKSPLHGKKVYLINWITGRYRLQVFALDHSKTLPAFEASGKCEVIHPWSPPPK